MEEHCRLLIFTRHTLFTHVTSLYLLPGHIFTYPIVISVYHGGERLLWGFIITTHKWRWWCVSELFTFSPVIHTQSTNVRIRIYLHSVRLENGSWCRFNFVNGVICKTHDHLKCETTREKQKYSWAKWGSIRELTVLSSFHCLVPECDGTRALHMFVCGFGLTKITWEDTVYVWHSVSRNHKRARIIIVGKPNSGVALYASGLAYFGFRCNGPTRYFKSIPLRAMDFTRSKCRSLLDVCLSILMTERCKQWYDEGRQRGRC